MVNWGKVLGIIIILIIIGISVLSTINGKLIFAIWLIAAIILGIIINISISKTKKPFRNMDIFFTILGALFIIAGIVLIFLEETVSGINALIPGVAIFFWSLIRLIKRK